VGLAALRCARCPEVQCGITGVIRLHERSARAISHHIRILADHVCNAGLPAANSMDATNIGARGRGDNPGLDARLPRTYCILRTASRGKMARAIGWRSVGQDRCTAKSGAAIVSPAWIADNLSLCMSESNGR